MSRVKPNVLLIVADDLGYGDLGCFGNQIACTPALDSLDDSGIALRQHYSGSPVCAPARACLLTGRYPHRTGVIDTREARGLDRLALRELTLADRLASDGYRTGLVGKWHLGSLDTRYEPTARGFHEFIGFHGAGSDYWDYRLHANGHLLRSDGRYLTDRFTDEAISFISRNRREPFFLEVAYNAPHVPLQAPEGLARQFLNAGCTEPVATVYAMIAAMDAGIARILETLDRVGVSDNTIVLFVSDNGPDMFGSPDLSGEPDPVMRRFNGNLTGSKGMVFEGGIRVPAILRWPDGVRGGVPSDLPIHFIDWVPTLLAMTGARPASEDEPRLDGANLIEQIQAGDGNCERRLWWQWNRYAPVPEANAAMRDGDWKLVRPRIPEAMTVDFNDSLMDRSLRGDAPMVTSVVTAPLPERNIPPPPPPMLFDLSTDPYEQTDLSSAHPHVVARMQTELDEWFYDVESERGNIRD